MSKITLQEEASTPATPGSGKWSFYAKADGGYLLDDAGNEIRLYTGSTAADHEALSGLLGGSANNHFHLTPTQVIALVSGTVSTLHSHSGTVIQDEGIFKGNVSTFNFVGTTIDASVSGTVARIFVTGSVGGSSAPYNSSDFTGTLWTDLTDSGYTNIHNHSGTYNPYVAPSTSGNVLTSDGAGNWVSNPPANRNAIINGGFRVSQRGTTFNSTTTPANSDDTFLLDRWNLLSDGNDIVDVSQETSATIANPAYNIKLDVETANKKFGIIQFLEQKDARRLINQSVSLSFKAKITGTTINAIRAAVIAWDGTADILTSDVVSAWEAAGTNPTLVANWTYENTPAALTAPTTSWQSYSIENISIDTASAKNVAVFIWTDDATMDVADFLHIADVKLEVGATATAFEFRPFAQELALCQRYCERTENASAYSSFGFGLCKSTTVAQFALFFKVTKRAAPAIVFSAGNTFLVSDGVTNTAGTSIALVAEASPGVIHVDVTVASGLTQFRPVTIAANNQAAGAAYIIANCEL